MSVELARKTITRLPPRLVGILCVVAAVTIFSTQDMGIKWLSGGYPLHEIVFLRAIVAICVTLAIMVPLEGGYHLLLSRRIPLHLLRGFALVIGNMTFFAGLASLPLSEAVAIFFTAPLIITLLAVPLLGEKIGLLRISAVLIGLAGAVIVMQPGSATFQMVALLPLIAAVAYSLMTIMTRKLGMSEKASTMAFYIQLMFIVASSLMWLVAGDGRYSGGGNASSEFLLRAWVWPSAHDGLIIFAIGFFNAFGGYLIGQGYRMCAASVVAPFEYVAIPLSVFWGVVLWGDWPAPTAWLGILMICGGGLFVAYRESRPGHRSKLGAKPILKSR